MRSEAWRFTFYQSLCTLDSFLCHFLHTTWPDRSLIPWTRVLCDVQVSRSHAYVVQPIHLAILQLLNVNNNRFLIQNRTPHKLLGTLFGEVTVGINKSFRKDIPYLSSVPCRKGGIPSPELASPVWYLSFSDGDHYWRRPLLAYVELIHILPNVS